MKELGSQIYASVDSNHLVEPFNGVMLKRACPGLGG